MTPEEIRYDLDKLKLSVALQTETFKQNARLVVYQAGFLILSSLLSFSIVFSIATGTLNTQIGLSGVVVLLTVIVFGFYGANFGISRQQARAEKKIDAQIDDLVRRYSEQASNKSQASAQ